MVDDHPAVLTGLLVTLRTEPGIVPSAGAKTAEEALAEGERHAVDVALVDYHLPDEDGLHLCRQLKALDSPPQVLVYSAFAGTGLGIPARVAGADGLLDKGVEAETLLNAIREVHRGGKVLPPVSPDQLEAAAVNLDEDDLPVLAMLVSGTPQDAIAEVLCIEPLDLEARLDAMLKRLRRRSQHRPRL
ncbi:MAG TPA: response regulator transcription factor [Solirubrobacterales bacterium]